MCTHLHSVSQRLTFDDSTPVSSVNPYVWYFLILKSDQNEKQSYVRYQPGFASGNIKNCPVPTRLGSLCIFYTIKQTFPGSNPVTRRIRTIAIQTEKLSQNTLHLREKNRTLSIKIPLHQMCTEFHTTLSRYTQIISSLCN